MITVCAVNVGPCPAVLRARTERRLKNSRGAQSPKTETGGAEDGPWDNVLYDCKWTNHGIEI